MNRIPRRSSNVCSGTQRLRCLGEVEAPEKMQVPMSLAALHRLETTSGPSRAPEVEPSWEGVSPLHWGRKPRAEERGGMKAVVGAHLSILSCRDDLRGWPPVLQ